MSKPPFQVDESEGPRFTRAFVLHPDIKSDRNRRGADLALAEAVSLAHALRHLEVVGHLAVPLPKVHAGMLFGKGKIEELRARFEAEEVELVLVDGPVTPVQQRNLEKAWGVKLLDRTGLILEIFSDRAATRAARAKVPFPIVALVGYTNAGKSTLFNRLTGANVMAEDMLFATLDPTMRRVELDNGPEIILSDTVGFISDLPTELVAAFRATLEEVLAADIICHVRDISHPETEDQADDVREILTTLGVGNERPMFEIWNKIDLLPEAEAEAAQARAARDQDIIAISALNGTGVDSFMSIISDALQGRVSEEVLRLSFAQGKKRAWLFSEGVAVDEVQDEDGFAITVRWTPKQRAQFEQV